MIGAPLPVPLPLSQTHAHAHAHPEITYVNTWILIESY